MDWLLLVAGAVVVAGTGADVFLTVLHPTRPGPLSFNLSRGVFATLATLSRWTGRSSLLSPAGPAGMAGVFVAWVMLFWIGYALIYLPNLGDLSFRASVDYGDHDLMEALYFSGMSLTTVGFGDIVPETDGYRLVSVLQAATGFAVFTAAITYVLSIYPRVSTERVAARSLSSCAKDPANAGDLVRGEPFLLSVQQQVLEYGEHTDRFPVLFYFHSQDEEASKVTFLRGAVIVCLMARWAVASSHVAHTRRWGQELEQSLERTVDHYAMRFMHGHGPADLDRRWKPAEARRRLNRLVEAAGDAGDRGVIDDPEQVESFARFAGRCEQFLEHVARQHRQPHRPLVEV